MPPCAFKRAHWAQATTWAISFWAIDRPSEPQLSSWSCELDSGHTLHGDIVVVALSGLIASYARRFFDFGPRYVVLLSALRLIGASKGAVGEEVVAFYDEESARSRFSGQRRALSSRSGPVRPTTL